MTKLPVVPRRGRRDLQRQQEGVEVGGVDEDAAPPAPAAAAVVRQTALGAPSVEQGRGNACLLGSLFYRVEPHPFTDALAHCNYDCQGSR